MATRPGDAPRHATRWLAWAIVCFAGLHVIGWEVGVYYLFLYVPAPLWVRFVRLAGVALLIAGLRLVWLEREHRRARQHAFDVQAASEAGIRLGAEALKRQLERLRREEQAKTERRLQ